MRLVAYTVAPIVTLVAIYVRIRSVDLPHNTYGLFLKANTDNAGHPK